MSERDRTDLSLTGKIEAIHRRSKEVYGAPSIHAELADDYGIRVGRKRVARLMRAAGLRGATLRRYVVTTQPDLQAQRAVDLVDRQFYTDGPDRLWVADISVPQQAAEEMRDVDKEKKTGLSQPACRSGLQTTASGWGQKPWS